MDADLDTIAALEVGRSRAIVGADVAFLARMTDDDYTHVEMNGQLRSKAEFLQALSSGSARFSRYDTCDELIRIVGETAIVTGSFENEVIGGDGTASVRQGRHCRIYVRRQDGWKNILHQGTRIAGAG